MSDYYFSIDLDKGKLKVQGCDPVEVYLLT